LKAIAILTNNSFFNQKRLTEKLGGKILLIPSALGVEGISAIPEESKQMLMTVEYFIVENERSARRFLRSIGYSKNFAEVGFQKLERDEDFEERTELIDYLKSGKIAAVMSEAGCPGIADPGAAVARWAHQSGIAVVPVVGPSSIFLALMASGLNGQQFAFHGYLPIESATRKIKIRQLEEDSLLKNQTQIFIETPYRNDGLVKDILSVCRSPTELCIASDITLPSENIRMQTIAEWKKNGPNLKKKPTIFLLLSRKKSRAEFNARLKKE
jgi:16S rRNA (cytidine1402-2'-O)-methyltransferase